MIPDERILGVRENYPSEEEVTKIRKSTFH